MKALLVLALVPAWLISACDSIAQAPAASEYAYGCESGRAIVATYLTADTATVRYQEQTLDMRIARSASGARYVGHGLEWWTKGSGPGSEGTLYRHLPDGTTGETMESCTAS